MKKVLSLFAVAALSVVLTTPALAQKGNVSLTWGPGSCDPVVQNLNFTGPGQVANLILTVLGAADQHKGYRFKILIGQNLSTALPNAWRFDAAGCNTGQLGVSGALVSKACPAFQGGNPLLISNYGYQTDKSNTATLDVLNAYDTATPTSTTRYAAFQANFDHLFSDSGPQDPAVACGNADTQICFWLFLTEFLNPDLTVSPFGITNDYVTWNDAANSNGCPTVQVNETTWGRVKGLYR